MWTSLICIVVFFCHLLGQLKILKKMVRKYNLTRLCGDLITWDDHIISNIINLGLTLPPILCRFKLLVVRLGREPHRLQDIVVISKIVRSFNSTLTEWLCRSRQNSILWLKAICGSLNSKERHSMQRDEVYQYWYLCDRTWCCKRRWCPWTAWCHSHDQAPPLSHHLWSPWKLFDTISLSTAQFYYTSLLPIHI